MKFRVSMTHTVTFSVEAESDEQLRDWMSTRSPREILAIGIKAEDSYDDEIIANLRSDSEVDYVIA